MRLCRDCGKNCGKVGGGGYVRCGPCRIKRAKWRKVEELDALRQPKTEFFKQMRFGSDRRRNGTGGGRGLLWALLARACTHEDTYDCDADPA